MEIMETALIRQRWGWEYVSENGNKYAIGPVTAEFNVVVDDFEDVHELFNHDALIKSHLVDYMYGELSEDNEDIKEWLDWRISNYEKHERTVKFYTNYTSRADAEVLYECYIGTEEQKTEETTKIAQPQMHRIAKEMAEFLK